MTHYDKDNRFMAASDLVAYLANNKVDSVTQGKITAAVLAQFSDSSVEVQGHAVKCISKIVGSLTADELKEVIKRITDNMVNGEAHLRDVYSTCFESFLPELPDSVAESVWATVLPRCVEVPADSAERCLSLLVATFKRFGKFNFWRGDISRLTAFAGSALPGRLRRRGVALLGALAIEGAPIDL